MSSRHASFDTSAVVYSPQIGSGFDIAAACFGSQRYTRFPASMLAGFTSPSSLRPADIARCITDHDSWEVQRRTVRSSLKLSSLFVAAV